MDVVRGLAGVDRFYIALAEQMQERGGLKRGALFDDEESAIGGVTPASCAAHSLEEAGDGGRTVDLDHAVEIAHVDAELEGAGSDDGAVVALFEGSFRIATGSERERAVAD